MLKLDERKQLILLFNIKKNQVFIFLKSTSPTDKITANKVDIPGMCKE